MNLYAFLFSLLLLAAPASPAKEQSMKTKDGLSAYIKYEIPKGWEEELSLNQGDPQAVLSLDLHKIKIRLSGGEKSRSKSAGDFLVGLEARSKGGKLPEKKEFTVVSGMRVMLYRREIAVSLPPPGTGGPSAFAREEFCVVPAGKRFFILSYSHDAPIPDTTYNGLETWRKFLKSFRVLKAKPAGK